MNVTESQHPHRMNSRQVWLRLRQAATLACTLLICCSPKAQPNVRLFLQNPLEYTRPGDRCTSEACHALIELLDGARERIDFAVYGTRDQEAILHAVLRAQERGVDVRGYVDKTAKGDNYYESTEQWAAAIGNVRDDQAREQPCTRDFDNRPPCPRPPGFNGPVQCLAYEIGNGKYLTAAHASREDIGAPNMIMHNKFFVVDRQHIWTGSANISNTGTGGYNANAVVTIDSRDVADVYLKAFERLWTRGAGCHKERDRIEPFRLGNAVVTSWFSPQYRSQTYGISGLLARARREIHVAIFFLTSKQLTADLIDAHRRGVKVRVIIDATAAKNGYSKHEILRQAGIPLKVEDWGGKMHMKAATIDGRYLVLGSMNWTSAGEYTNDENSLLVDSPALALQFDAHYEKMWTSISSQWQKAHARPDPESQSSGTSCTDGIDNDFDRLIDATDPGCSSFPPPLPALPPYHVIGAAEYGSVNNGIRWFTLRSVNPENQPGTAAGAAQGKGSVPHRTPGSAPARQYCPRRTLRPHTPPSACSNMPPTVYFEARTKL